MRWNRIITAAAIAATLALYAQSPAFEVAAIRQNTTGPFVTMLGPTRKKGSLTGLMVTHRRMLSVAYGVSEPLIIGPDWLDKNRFDIAGRSPQGVPDTEFRPMLQALLKDRFKLETHFETRLMPVYYMVVAKGGIKMPVYPATDSAREHPNDDPNVRGFPMARGDGTRSKIAELLTHIVNRQVIDRTGSTKRYNWFLSFAPLTPQAGDEVRDFDPPDFFTAIQKQLGLRLDPGKDNLKVVIVDHMEQLPTEN